MKFDSGKRFFLILILALSVLTASAETIKGTILDKLTREPLTGATIQIAGTTQGAVADLDGNFVWTDLARGTYTLIVKYVGYKDIKLTGLKVDRTELTLTIEMESDAQALGEVSVTAQAKRNTEALLVNEQRRSLVVQSGVSAQQIARTQDKDASEVIRRVPGVSIIDEKFVMVRGLSQRYNNVWMNGSAVPSSEADTRAFSFDILPSSQLDNMVIVKSPAPEYPADFTGGFILISTKSMPSENLFNVSIGTSLNDQTHLKDFLYNKGSKTDFLGFDNGLRSLQAGMKGVLNTHSGNDRRMDLLNNGLNNDWTIHQRRPLADLKLNLNYAHRWEMESGRRAGMLASISYSNTYKTYLNMENSLFGSYDTTHDHSVYLRRSTDDQYNQDVRLGVLLNLMYQPKNSRHHYEFKNLFNQTGKSRYTSRNGFDAQSNDEQSMEYYYSSRSTYNGQFTGKHTSDNGQLDWSTGYSYANRNLPDRRRILLNDSQETGVIALATGNDISREFTRLEEHIGSAGVNYRHRFQFGSLAPSLKAGAYAEYRTRDYHTRQFCYGWGNEMPAGFNRWDVTTEILQDSNYGIEKLYLYEQVRKTYDYSGNQWLAAGYAGVNLPVSNRLGMYAGVRYEYSRMELVRNTRDEEESPRSLFYTHRDWFPSVNAAYQLSEKQQLRLSYGQSVNRPEFREVSTSVYYDFDLASNVEGNPSLKPAYVHNIDFRYEWYPAAGESVSVALFYKHFKNPIEWTYTVNGGTDLTYSNLNAPTANNYGIEVDIRKNLGFLGLKNFNWSFNGALIRSRVHFEADSREEDRAMQGQSPYLINTGLFYQHPEWGLNVAVLYNRIGKRIIGVGRTVGTSGDQTTNIPNSYEMPHDALDVSISQRLGAVEIKAGVRDVLAGTIHFKQFGSYRSNGKVKDYEEITRSFKPGRSFQLSVTYAF